MQSGPSDRAMWRKRYPMFIPHVSVPHRRGGRRPTRGQRLGGVVGAVVGALVSAVVGVGFTRGSRADLVALVCVIAGLATLAGFLLAKVIGRQGKL
jgi:uncharacterized protein YcfJ